LRPGAKLYEELLIGDNPMPTDHPRIMKAQEQYLEWPLLSQHLSQLEQHLLSANVDAVYAKLQELVSGFKPDSEVVDLIAKA
jgi:FlaA1/EpsC-like NDP-sugar epimerase